MVSSKFPWLIQSTGNRLWMVGFASVLSFALRANDVVPRETPPTAETDASATEQSNDSGKSLLLAPFFVSAPKYNAILTPIELARLRMAFDLHAVFGWPEVGGAFVLTPERAPQPTRSSAYTVLVLDERVGEPASHGLSNVPMAWLIPSNILPGGRVRTAAESWTCGFRGIQQTRVLLDRVLVNDAFDGTVHLSELPQAGLARIEIVPSGGASAWGETPAGVVQLFTAPAMGRIDVDAALPPGADPDYPPPPRQTVRRTGILMAEVGNYGTRRFELEDSEPTPAGMVQVLGRVAESGGFITALPRWRGSLDTAGWERHRWVEVRWRRPLGKQIELTATLSGSDERRGLGTPYQFENTDMRFASIELAGHNDAGFAWNGVSYLRGRGARRTFSAVDTTRVTETPLIDEFAEPVVSGGFSWTGTWQQWHEARTTVGTDLRATRGEARSNIISGNGILGREIVSGGEQANAGFFAIHHRRIGKGWIGMAGIRIDFRRETEAHMRQTDRVSGAQRDDRTLNSRSTEFSPSVGIVREIGAHWTFRAAGQESFRPATLAERYRIFGQRSWLIEPNADLKTEHVTSGECSVAYVPSPAITLTARGFSAEYRDAPGTQLITPGVVDSLGFDTVNRAIERRARVALHRVEVRGGEVSIDFHPQTALTMEASLRLQEATISDRRFSAAGGRQLPGLPHRVATVAANWRASRKLLFRGEIRWLGREFVDEENTDRLGEVVLANFSGTYALQKDVRLFLQIENIANAPVSIGRGPNGVRYGDAPRTVRGGLRTAW